MGKPVLGYWDIRGLAQPIRMLLAYTGTEFEDKLYVVTGEPGKWDRSDWLNVKPTLGLDFPNLPYYMDDDVKITQSNAIMRYIANKNELVGTNIKEKANIDMLEGQVCDFRMGFVQLCYVTFNEGKDDYKANVLPQKLAGFSAYLEKAGNKWLIGEQLCFVDFILYEVLDQHLIFDPECLAKYDNLRDYHSRFQKIPEVAKFLTSPNCIKDRLNNRMAKFGSGN